MIASGFMLACDAFAKEAEPYLHIKDEAHYEEALQAIETLMEQAEDSLEDPRNSIITMLSAAIEEYENEDPELAEWGHLVEDVPQDLAVLRVLMDQHGLGTADLPEIGSKSMVSRVLSGQRELTKKHILALSDRFGIRPGVFLG